MEKRYDPAKTEKRIYAFWEKGGYFTPKAPSKGRRPFTILLPPPNANAPMHAGHSLFTVEDILCRYHRMRGEPTLFLPGTDHAGIETQYVFEKKLAEKGKSRFDFDRKTLYRKINDYVEENRGIAKAQLKEHGFSLDWTRERYTLDPKILTTVFETFKKLHQDGLIYRDERIVNYCPRCGTAFSELEVVYKERQDPLFYMKYGPFTLATVRPETKFGDTAVAVHPQDKRYKKWVGKEFVYDSLIGPRKMRVVADKAVDPEFGTGAVKVTPAHDPNDFEIAQRHNLPKIKIIDQNGRLNKNAGRFAGLTIGEARKKVAQELKKKGDLVKVDRKYTHRMGFCYKCKGPIEPTLMPQWFVKIAPLAKPAIEVVKSGKIKIFPTRFKKLYLQWMENIRDWNISRQIVWGPQIPAWYCLDCNPEILLSFISKKKRRITGTWKRLKNDYSFSEVKTGLQSLVAPKEADYYLKDAPCPKCRSKNYLQETDTFDTWFSSGQWPLTTLGFSSKDESDFDYFYPTSVLDTLWDILFFWVARMIMLGLYRTQKIPFEIVHLHCRVVDAKGQKMSKSRGNVVNPSKIIEQYGADALRMALVFGVAPGSDIPLSEDKVRAMRNFSNKIWNIARFILGSLENTKIPGHSPTLSSPENPLIMAKWPELYLLEKFRGKLREGQRLTKEDSSILDGLGELIKQVTHKLNTYRFDLAADGIYHFLWHEFADKYIEEAKERARAGDQAALAVLRHVYLTSLKLLHPFMPFVTEEVWSKFPKKESEALIVSKWPEKNAKRKTQNAKV
jgi:valyl-tRNA synthetase